MEILGGGTTPERHRRKLEALDGIRGVAVLVVMLSHFERFLPPGVLSPLKSVFGYGWIGVDLFFVLSGFLITGILLATRTAENYLRSFYARRTLRIFPIYYATLVLVFIVAALFPRIAQVPPVGDRWLYFVYLTNWIAVFRNAWPPNVVGHFWSLAIEEQFYLVWPLCVLLLSRKTLFRTAVAASAIALAIRIVWLAATGGPNEGILLATFTRMDSLLLGAIGAMVFEGTITIRLPNRLAAWSLVPLGAFVVGALASPKPLAFVESIGYTLLALGFGMLVLDAARGDGAARGERSGVVQRVFRNAVLRNVGKYSYGMYVYHVLVLGACELVIFNRIPEALRANPLVGLCYIGGLTLVTYAVSVASFELVEKRILGFKRYFESGRTRPEAMPVPVADR